MDPEDIPANKSKFKAMIAFLPYAARREENGAGKPPKESTHTTDSHSPPPPTNPMLDFKLTVQFSGVVLPISFKYMTLVAVCDRFSFLFLEYASDTSVMIQLWITVASTLPYTDDVGQRTVKRFFQWQRTKSCRHISPSSHGGG